MSHLPISPQHIFFALERIHSSETAPGDVQMLVEAAQGKDNWEFVSRSCARILKHSSTDYPKMHGRCAELRPEDYTSPTHDDPTMQALRTGCWTFENLQMDPLGCRMPRLTPGTPGTLQTHWKSLMKYATSSTNAMQVANRKAFIALGAIDSKSDGFACYHVE